MTVIVPPDYGVANVVMRSPGGSRDYTFSVAYQATTAVAAKTQVDGIDTAIKAPFSLMVAADLLAGWTYQGIDGFWQSPSGPIPISNLNVVTGIKSGTSIPVNGAMLVNKVTDTGGRKGRGRMYMPPAWIAETNIDDQGNIASGAFTVWRNQVDAWLSLMDTASIDVYLLHSEYVLPTLFPSPIVRLDAQTRIATQRRRMRR